MKNAVLGILTGLLLVGEGYGQPDTNRQPIGQAKTNSKHPKPVPLEAGYQTPVTGWVLRVGDTLQLGRGSRPDKTFAFFSEGPASPSASSAPAHLPASYGGRRVVLTDLRSSGSPATGYGVYGVIDVDGQPPYHTGVDDAIEGGELLPPVKYRPSARAAPAVPASVARQLIQLKTQLETGTITRQEYDARRKKLLN